jgi:hypothetical protein
LLKQFFYSLVFLFAPPLNLLPGEGEVVAIHAQDERHLFFNLIGCRLQGLQVSEGFETLSISVPQIDKPFTERNNLVVANPLVGQLTSSSSETLAGSPLSTSRCAWPPLLGWPCIRAAQELISTRTGYGFGYKTLRLGQVMEQRRSFDESKVNLLAR